MSPKKTIPCSSPNSRAYKAGTLGSPLQGNPFAFMDDLFANYVHDRRRRPTGDIMTDMALAPFPDGSLPEVLDIVHLATFLFAAGQGTTAHLIGMAMRHLAERETSNNSYATTGT